MGLLHALERLPRGMGKEGSENGLYSLPLGVLPQGKEAFVIRLWLDVDDPQKVPLKVRGITRVDVENYMGGTLSEAEWKERYGYRKENSPGAPWRYTPLHKAGKAPKKDLLKSLGIPREWREDKNTQLYKMHRSFIADLESRGTLAPGGAEIIMQALEERTVAIAQLWEEVGESTIFLFGVAQEGEFRYPGEVPAFRHHMEQCAKPKHGKASGKTSGRAQKKLYDAENTSPSPCCSLCGGSLDKPDNLSSVFAFATFDKGSYFPGASQGNAGKPWLRRKIFPLCSSCISRMREGKRIMSENLSITKLLPGMKISVVPEILQGEGTFPRWLRNRGFVKQTESARGEDVTEERFFHLLAEEGQGLVYHFLLWEQPAGSAKEQVHLLLEDIPPSWLRELGGLWREALEDLGEAELFDTLGKDLDGLMLVLRGVFFSMAGMQREEKNCMRTALLHLLERLFMGSSVDPSGIRSLMNSRLQGLCVSETWCTKKIYGIRGMNALSEFFERYQRHLLKNMESAMTSAKTSAKEERHG